LEEVKQVKEAKAEELLISNELYARLIALSKANAISINSILQYAWHKLLSVYGNSNTTITGTTVSGRNLPIDDIEYSVGLYINTLPLVIRHTNQPILEQLQQIQQSINEINERSNVNLSKLHSETSSGRRLFDSLFIYENYPIPQVEKEQGLRTKFIETVEKLDYPLGIIAYERDSQVIFKLKYDQTVFTANTIQVLLDKIRLILEQVVEINNNPNLSSISLLTK